MGTSTDAYLFFGFSFSDQEVGQDTPDWLDEDMEWEAIYAERHDGINKPDVVYIGHEHVYSTYWQAKREAAERASCEIAFHCSGDYPIWFVALQGTRFVASRGDEVEVKLPNIHEEQITEMRAFCELLGIKWKEPKWLLVSYWG